VRQAVPADDSKRAAYRALEDRVRTGPGRASSEERDRAFRNAGLEAPLDGLLGDVATRPTHVTDLQFSAARAAGYSEDQLFELVICAAVGQAGRQYDAGLAALADAVAAEEDQRAS
jgi:alkylhydroperoxidase family enzyme